MRSSEYPKTFLDEAYEDGEAEGEAKGEARGEARGKAEGKADAVLRLLRVRGVALTDEQRQQVATSADLAQLDRWFYRAITAATAADVFTD
jgi:predicted transposase YdaD